MTEFVGLQRTAELVAAGDASSVEVVTEALDRIEKAQPTLNAFRRLRRDAALAEAALAALAAQPAVLQILRSRT